VNAPTGRHAGASCATVTRMRAGRVSRKTAVVVAVRPAALGVTHEAVVGIRTEPLSRRSPTGTARDVAAPPCDVACWELEADPPLRAVVVVVAEVPAGAEADVPVSADATDETTCVGDGGGGAGGGGGGGEGSGALVVGSGTLVVGSGTLVVGSGGVVTVGVGTVVVVSSAIAARGPPATATRHAASPTHFGSQRLIRG
jgi:hypothetical protein